MSPAEKERRHTSVQVQIEYGFDCFQVQSGLVVSTVWIGPDYGFVILLDESASESHAKPVLGQHPNRGRFLWASGSF